MRRVVISGAGGFLGQNLIREARDKAIPVLAITSKCELIGYENVEYIDTKAFLCNKERLYEEDVFINCMFPTNADGAKLADGLKNVYSMIDSARKSGVGAFVNISSQSVYSFNRKNPANEKTHLSLETPYAVGKYSTEAFTNEVFESVPHTNIRLSSLIGVGYGQRIVNRMIAQALKGETLKVVGGMQRYGFLDVRDAASGLVTVSQSPTESWKQEYNLGRVESYTLIEIVEVIINELKERGVSARYEMSEGHDTRNSSIDPRLFYDDFNWKPHFPLEQTVKDIIANVE